MDRETETCCDGYCIHNSDGTWVCLDCDRVLERPWTVKPAGPPKLLRPHGLLGDDRRPRSSE